MGRTKTVLLTKKIGNKILNSRFTIELFAAVLFGCAAPIAHGNIAAEKNSDFEFGTNVKFITERVSHGVRSCGKAVVPSVALGYKISDDLKVSLSADVIAALVDKYSRVAPCLGVTYYATDIFTLDAGYTHYIYASAVGDAQKNSNEIYAGATVNILLSPALYTFYDFDGEDFSIDASVSHSFDMSERIIDGLSFDVGASIGYENVGKLDGKRIEGQKRDFIYYGVSGDIVCAINANAKAKIGVSYGGNSAKLNSWVNGPHRNFVWVTASLGCSF
ncbi:MAG: hypothetical protein LBI61_01840 [Puniceicoccales bacterium]|jgi:hypothetical protein|nr:hypothetical protein [Puniceicoccales bacterium]